MIKTPRFRCTMAAWRRPAATSWMPLTLPTRSPSSTPRNRTGSGRERRQDAAPGSRCQLRASEVRPGLGDRSPRRRDRFPDRYRSEEEPANAWKVVQTLKAAGGGQLFLEDASEVVKNLWVDAPLNPDPKPSRNRSPCSTSTTSTRASNCCRSGGGPASRMVPSASSSRNTTRPATKSGSRCGAAPARVGDRRRR